MSHALLCVKCEDPTTVNTSTANGRNALKRVCNACGATDRWLNREADDGKGTKKRSAPLDPAEAEEADKRAKVARTLKQKIKTMSPEERAQ
eukprot:2390353-Pyramimonas_sp.AAC.1